MTGSMKARWPAEDRMLELLNGHERALVLASAELHGEPHEKARLGATTVQTHLPPQYQDRIVWGLNGRPTTQTWRYLTAQARCEGGNASWNPCNSTLWVQNFTLIPNYNDVGVRNYSYPNVGVCAHVLTLTQRDDGIMRFGEMYGELQQNSVTGRTAEEMVERSRANIHLWGTDPDLMLQVLASL